MGFLDNSSVTVDAVLTKKGREILKDGGNLNITSFTVSDTGVDYSLWNADHPSGSAFYGEALENMPMVEATVHAKHNVRNRLVSLNQNTVAIPALLLANMDALNGETKTFDPGDEANGEIPVKLSGYTPNRALGMTLILDSPHLFTVRGATLRRSLSGTSRVHLHSEDINHAQEWHFSGDSFTLIPISQDETGRETIITVMDVESGAYAQARIINNIDNNRTALLSSGGKG